MEKSPALSLGDLGGDAMSSADIERVLGELHGGDRDGVVAARVGEMAAEPIIDPLAGAGVDIETIERAEVFMDQPTALAVRGTGGGGNTEGETAEVVDAVTERETDEILEDLRFVSRRFIEANKVAIQAARDRLRADGINPDSYLREGLPRKLVEKRDKELLGERRANLRELAEAIKEGKISPEQKEIMDKIGMRVPDDVLVDDGSAGRQESASGETRQPTGAGSGSVAEVDSTRREGRKKKMFEVTDEDTLDREIESIREIKDPQARADMFRALSRQLFEEKKYGWGDKVARERVIAVEEATREASKRREEELIGKIEGLPDDRGDAGAWLEWARSRMARVLTNGGRVERGNGGIFSATMEDTGFGRGLQNVDASPYMSKFAPEVFDKIMGKTRRDGRTEIVGELDNVQELGELYKEWKSNHGSVKALSEAIDRKSYKLPSGGLNKAFLNDLESENGVEGGGSKKVARVVQIYWAMAHSGDPGISGLEAETILDSAGLRDLLFDTVGGKYRSLYSDNKLSDLDIDKIRARIAEECGGTFYDNLGFMYAGFFGISAYGSNSTLPGIKNIDGMGLMVHTETNRFASEPERLSSSKRDYRWLPDQIANNLGVREWAGVGGDKAMIDSSTGKTKVIELGPHTGNLQRQIGAKESQIFYLVRRKGSGKKFESVKKIGTVDAEGVPYARNIDAVDNWWKTNEQMVSRQALPDESLPRYELDENVWEQVTLEELIKEGKIDEIDWGESETNVFGFMAFREKAAINMWKLFKEMDKEDLSKNVDPLERDKILVDKKTVIEEPMPGYNRQTLQYTTYLWFHSLIYRNSDRWLKDAAALNNVSLTVKRALELKMISRIQYEALISEYKVGEEGGFDRAFRAMERDLRKGLGL